MSAVAAAPALRLGFLGVGWIGRHRMKALLDGGLATVAVLADPDEQCLQAARELCGDIDCVPSLDAMLEQDLDGVVIATPSAAHAGQAIQVLERTLPVFCQKPLGRDHAEVQRVVTAAERAGRLLGVDLSYRHLAGMDAARALIASGALGPIYAVQAVFHNAYGPDKAWFYRRELAGGGCLIDLGIHLLDLAFWLLDDPPVMRIDGRCYSRGVPLREVPEAVEDYATARIELQGEAVIDLCCSWNLPIGVDAEIGLRVFGAEGAICLRNVGGSFYDFTVEHIRGREATVLGRPPDAWGGRAIEQWARALQRSPAFDPSAHAMANVARVLDGIYADALNRE